MLCNFANMDSDPRSSSGIGERKELNLPFGYRFDPTDVELLEYYLVPKLKGERLPSDYVIDLDVYQYEPHQLPLTNDRFKHTKENQAHFFTEDLRKNPVEEVQVRTTSNGYWKVYEENVPIYRANETIGSKTKLFFHDSDGNKTDWKMTEYKCQPNQIPTSSSSMKSYIVCKVKQKMKMEEENLKEELSEEENGINGDNHRPETM